MRLERDTPLGRRPPNTKTPGERVAYTAGDTALRRDAPRTRMLAGGLSTSKSVRILVPKPIITIGRNRNDVCVAEMYWTPWKRSMGK